MGALHPHTGKYIIGMMMVMAALMVVIMMMAAAAFMVMMFMMAFMTVMMFMAALMIMMVVTALWTHLFFHPTHRKGIISFYRAKNFFPADLLPRSRYNGCRIVLFPDKGKRRLQLLIRNAACAA